MGLPPAATVHPTPLCLRSPHSQGPRFLAALGRLPFPDTQGQGCSCFPVKENATRLAASLIFPQFLTNNDSRSWSPLQSARRASWSLATRCSPPPHPRPAAPTRHFPHPCPLPPPTAPPPPLPLPAAPPTTPAAPQPAQPDSAHTGLCTELGVGLGGRVCFPTERCHLGPVTSLASFRSKGSDVSGDAAGPRALRVLAGKGHPAQPRLRTALGAPALAACCRPRPDRCG